MDNDHGITGELREWFDRYTMRKDVYDGLTAIADRIDAAHEKAVMGAVTDALYYANGECMAELGWVRLPKDADGKYIHIGDEMETLISPFAGEHCAVEYIVLSADGWEVDGDAPTSMRHYCKPTVEDVLREFAQRWDDPTHYAKGELVEQYASKLRLAGDGKEQ